MVLNTEKTKIMLITTRQKRLYIDENNLTLSYNNINLQGGESRGLNDSVYGISC